MASLTLLVPLLILAGSSAPVAPALFVPSPRVASANLPLAATTEASDEVVASPTGDDHADEVVALAPDMPSQPAVGASHEPTVAPVATLDSSVDRSAPIAIPAATIVAAAPVILPTASPTPRPEPWNREASFNFVAVGVDQRAEGELTRTDTVMVGNVDVARHRLTVVSIPRDLFVEIPGYGEDRINTAYVYGEQFKEPDGGIGLLKRTIERNFGVPINHFGLVDFNCFRTAVDSIGGVTVDVPRAIVDTQYPTDDYGIKTVRFEEGRQRMDGERALEYARTRHADNDFHRIRRQQLVAAALRTELIQLRSLPALPSLIGGCRGMRSDLGWRDYLALAGVVRNLGDSDVTFRAISEDMAVDTTLSSGAAVLLPRWDPIRALIRDTFPEAPRRPATAELPDATVSTTIVGQSPGAVEAPSDHLH